MNIKNTPSLHYSDRTGYKSKSKVTEDRVSINNSFHETPLKRDSNDISFKGVFSLYKTNNFNLKRNMKLLEKYLGQTPRDLYKNFGEEHWVDILEDIKQIAPDNVQVRSKNWTKLLMEGFVYPITDLPLHIANSLKELVTGKHVPIKRTAAQMANRNILQKKMDTLNNADIVNSFSGYMESADKVLYDSDKIQSASLFTKAMKRFDQKSGNYNGVHERALTRIVTGFIPAFFLANDAYNLSRLCDDDPKKAKIEHDTRFNQETKRVLSNAYLQLITLGALSKYINSSKLVFAAVTALTVVATESWSRISNGKKIHFISSEEAIAINKKNNQNIDNETAKHQSVAEIRTAPSAKPSNSPNFKGSPIFTKFGTAADMPIVSQSISKPSQAKENLVVDTKPLLSMAGITKWFVSIILAGFAIRYAKKNLNINGAKLEKYFDVISKKYDEIYNGLTQEEFKITKGDFNKIVDKLRTYNETIAEKFVSVTQEHQQAVVVKRKSSEIAAKLRENGLDALAEGFDHLSNLKKNTKFADIKVNVAAKDFIKAKKTELIDVELKKFFELLKDAKLEEDAANIESLLYENGALKLNNYTQAKKYIEKMKHLKEFETTFENRFRVNEDEMTINMLKEASSAVRAKDSKLADEMIKLLEDAKNSDEYTFGKRNKSGWREFFDMVTQPFKFVWGTITLPYKHIANPIYKFVKQEYKLPEWEKEVDAVYSGIKKLTSKNRFLPGSVAKIDKNAAEFKQYMDDRINKAFNTATMSSISNSDLSALAKNTSTAATAWFLMCDNHNMVMLKSNGNDKDGAVLKAKERAIQETSRTFWNVLFINLFNDTFRDVFNSSLLGAQLVNTASTSIGEYVNRTFIGVPVGQKTKDEILNKEYENITDKGIKGDFFRFMTRLTGKKILSQREQSQKK